MFSFFLRMIFFSHLGDKPIRKALKFPGVGHSNYGIDTNEVRFPIDHFSSHLLGFKFKFRSSKRDIKMCCDTLLPRCMPGNRELTIRVYVYKAQQGMEEVKKKVKVGYIKIEKGCSLPFAYGDI